MSYLCYLCLFAYSGAQHILCCVLRFVCLRLVYPMLPVSLGVLLSKSGNFSMAKKSSSRESHKSNVRSFKKRKNT
jgi:hypothetical protein